MKIKHFMRKERSGLARSTLELATYEKKQGHDVTIQEPSGGLIYGSGNGKPDIQLVHSQMPVDTYFNNIPTLLFCHGEPLSSVGNGISMKAVVDLAPLCDAFVAMRKDEWIIWNAIKRCHLVRKGIDLEVYKPPSGIVEKLSGEPAVLYYENWRGTRNPLYAVIAMMEVWKKHPKARLHLYNCSDKRLLETFQSLIDGCKFWPFVRSLQGPVDDVPQLISRCDIVISCLFPLFARSVESFGVGKPLICPGYKEHDYPFQCELQPESMAAAILKCWQNYDQYNWRDWAIKYHNVNDTVKECIEIYRRYMD